MGSIKGKEARSQNSVFYLIRDVIFALNKVYSVINSLNIIRATIYKPKCYGIITLKILPRSCFSFNSEEKNTNKVSNSKNETKQG